MSILLEALRKSEKGQRPVEAPTIHQDELRAPESVTISRGPLIILLVAALIVIAWLVWRQYQPPEVGYQPPVTLPAKNTAQSASPVAEEATPEGVIADNAGANKSSGAQRTPVESYKQPVRVATAPVTARPDGGVVNPVSQNQAGKKQSNGKQVTQPGESSDSTSKAGKDLALPKTVVKQEKKSGQRAARNKDQASKNKTEFRPQEPAPISYWELPDSVRADIPEIKFSMLVYASDPADRFVLSNGQRLKEGDSYQQGLVVEEIQREGVVFSYRLYRFVVER